MTIELSEYVIDAIADAIVKKMQEPTNLPPVTPQHTDAEIQKMQELEQAEIKKAYELGKADVLDKIRAEIEEQKKERCFDDEDMFAYRTGLDTALDIIDKYRAESEESNADSN